MSWVGWSQARIAKQMVSLVERRRRPSLYSQGEYWLQTEFQLDYDGDDEDGKMSVELLYWLIMNAIVLQICWHLYDDGQ